MVLLCGFVSLKYIVIVKPSLVELKGGRRSAGTVKLSGS